MTKKPVRFGLMVAALGAMLAAAVPAQAITMAECSAKWKAAKADGSAAGTTWTDFRKTNCAADAPATTPAAAPAAPAAATPPAATPPAAAAGSPKPSAAKPVTPATASGPVVFPTAIDPKYASLSPGKQRQKTCLDQYHANKATGGNGGLKWIQTGGGYYSQCNTKLKTGT